MAQITHIPTQYPRHYPSLQPKTPQLIMNLLMNYIQTQQAEKTAEKRRTEKKYDSLEQYEREVKQSIVTADKAQERRRELMVEQRQFQVEKEGWKSVDPAKIPMENWGEDYFEIGDKYYRRPEQPHPRVAPIAGSSHKILTYQSGGKQHAKILNPAEASDWEEKEQHYKALLNEGKITGDEYKKGVGVYIKGKTIPMYKQHPGGIQRIEVEPNKVKDFEALEFKQGKFTPTAGDWGDSLVAKEGNEEGLAVGTVYQKGPKGQVKILEKPTKAKTPQLNALMKSGESLIAKGMQMDVALMDKYDVNRQKDYFDKVRKYHRILERKPEWHNAMGVRKAADLAVKMGNPDTTEIRKIPDTAKAIDHLMENFFMSREEATKWIRDNWGALR